MGRPGHEQIALLQRQVSEKERARAASAVLCRSLADETRQLRRTLAATAHMCQHLAKCLDARQGTVGQQSLEVGCGEGPPGRGHCLLTQRPSAVTEAGAQGPLLPFQGFLLVTGHAKCGRTPGFTSPLPLEL